MKFCTTWRARRNAMPPILQAMCLDYKQYKKCSKSALLEQEAVAIRAALLHDLDKVDEALSLYSDSLFPRGPMSLFGRLFGCSVDASDQDDAQSIAHLMDFVSLNKACFYKICKRLHKRSNARPSFLEWHKEIISSDDYKFLSPLIRTTLAIQTGVRTLVTEECPICLDPLTSAPGDPAALVLKCGHVLCTECALGMVNMAGANGTLHNRIAYGTHYHPHSSRCPLCRCQTALREFASIHRSADNTFSVYGRK